METRATRSKKRKAPVKAARGRGRKKVAVEDTFEEAPVPADIITNEPVENANATDDEEDVMLDQRLGLSREISISDAGDPPEVVSENTSIKNPETSDDGDELTLDHLQNQVNVEEEVVELTEEVISEETYDDEQIQEVICHEMIDDAVIVASPVEEVIESSNDIASDSADAIESEPLIEEDSNASIERLAVEVSENKPVIEGLGDSNSTVERIAVDESEDKPVIEDDDDSNVSAVERLAVDVSENKPKTEDNCDSNSTVKSHEICERNLPQEMGEEIRVCPVRHNIENSERIAAAELADVEKTHEENELPPNQIDDADDMDDVEGEPDDYDYDSDFDDSEIDEMLERDYKNAEKRSKLEASETPAETGQEAKADFETRKKIILDEKRLTHFEVLPEDWIKITHSSGMPVYLHRKLRVCTFSKPYFIGNGSARNHRVPLSSIPCLDYVRSIEEEKNQATNENGETVPQARVLTTEENDEVYHLSPEKLREYAQKVFQFKEIQMQTFRSWPARRNFQRQKRAKMRNSLPEGSKLITAPIKDPQSKRKVEWIMNPTGKTYVCIMHDYVQRALKKKPVYTQKEIDNTDTPYMVTISLDGVEYGSGLGSSKKLAKMEAAKNTLDILIPGMKDKVLQDPKMTGRVGDNLPTNELEFFDDIPIEDPRIVEYCTKTTEPLPHAILLTCLQRNFGLTETNVSCEMNARNQRKNIFTMKVGKHTVSVECANKREGKQKASQALLQILHPDVHSWGSLLRLYGNASIKTFNEKKVEEQEITSLQSRSDAKGPNLAILNKLKEEMLKLKLHRHTVCSIGEFKPPEDFMMQTTPEAEAEGAEA